MQLPSKSRNFHQKVVLFASEAVNSLLYCLLVVGLGGIAIGIFLAAKHLLENLNKSGEVIETLIIDMILVLAVVEVIRCILSYLDQGRVRVSLIIEVVLIVMLNEVIRGWFQQQGGKESIYLIIIISVLLALRIVAIRFGPKTVEKKQRDEV